MTHPMTVQGSAGKRPIEAALVQCPGWGRDCPPYALAALSAYLRSQSIGVRGFDFNNNLYHGVPETYRKLWDDKDYYVFWENPSRVAQLLRENPDLVNRTVRDILDTGARLIGFTTHTTSFLVSLELARRIKQEDASRVIAFGGPQCSREQAGKYFIEEPCVDLVCLLEGEEVLAEAVRRLRESPVLDRPISGTLMRLDGRPRDNGDRELIEDINALPFPDYSDFADGILGRRYRQPERLEILDSRGCVRRCHFCSEWQFWRRFRTMTGDRIFAEAVHQMKTYPGVNYFYFIGSLLNGDMRALTRFADLILENGIKMRFAGQAIVRPDMTRESIQKLARAGLEWLGFGIESGSQRMLKAMNKHFTIPNAEQVLKDCRDSGVSVQINIIFGPPGETREDFQETLDFLRRVRPNIDTVLASQSFTVIDKGTIYNTRPDQFDLVGVDHHLFWESRDGKNTYPERLRRYEEFCRLALELGIPETSGVLRVKPDKWFLLGDYYAHKKIFARAVLCYLRSWRAESRNKAVLVKIAECCRHLRRPDRAVHYYRKALEFDASVEGFSDDPYDAGIRRALAELESPPGGAAGRQLVNA
jgi:anaerobic magnesium-protoporphyrin IX monomethyl ester cyclase